MCLLPSSPSNPKGPVHSFDYLKDLADNQKAEKLEIMSENPILISTFLPTISKRLSFN